MSDWKEGQADDQDQHGDSHQSSESPTATTEVNSPAGSESTGQTQPVPLCHRINEDVARLIERGLNSEQIGKELGVESYNVRGCKSWKQHVVNKRSNSNGQPNDGTRKKRRRQYGTIVVPRAKADVLDNLKQAGARLRDELMRSPNSYQCNYFLIKREAETICALLERFLPDE